MVLVAFGFVVVLNAQPLALATIHLYQQVLSPVAEGMGIRCRFVPTCSRYAEIVIRRDGIVRGGWKTIERISRCGPWTPAGSVDPP